MWHKIFVYGTLKSGQCNHHLLKCNHHLLKGKTGYTAIAPQIDLHAGPHYPFAVRGPRQARGEMYEIDNLVLQQLDKLEGHPHDYKRELTPIILADGQTTEAWIYLNNKAHRYPLIPDGHWQPSSLGG